MDTFTALADPTRRHIIEMLVIKKELSASEISNKFSMSTPAISQHLKVLRDTDFVHVEKRAQQRIYMLNSKKLSELETWITNLTGQYEKKFQRIDTLLETEKKLKGGE